MNSGASCLLCGSRRFEHLVTGYDRMRASASDYAYARCAACGLVAMRPLPSPKEIPGFYPDGYEPHAAPRALRRDKFINRMAIRYFYGADSLAQPPTMRRAFRLFSGRIMRDLLEARGSCRMLDVGCGGGLLTEEIAALGFCVTGIDPSLRSLEIARAHAAQPAGLLFLVRRPTLTISTASEARGAQRWRRCFSPNLNGLLPCGPPPGLG